MLAIAVDDDTLDGTRTQRAIDCRCDSTRMSQWSNMAGDGCLIRRLVRDASVKARHNEARLRILNESTAGELARMVEPSPETGYERTPRSIRDICGNRARRTR
jgi:hypothetical protein